MLKPKAIYSILTLILLIVIAGGLLFLLRSGAAKPEQPASPGIGDTETPGEGQVESTPKATITQEKGFVFQPTTTSNKGIVSQPTTTGDKGMTPEFTSLTPEGSQTPQATPKSGPAQPTLTMLPTEVFVARTPTPAGRQAPDVTVDKLKFTQVWVYPAEKTESFAGRANMTNTGNTFMNGLIIEWKILGDGGSLLDQGQVTWPNLAPGETSTISFTGNMPYADTWTSVAFKPLP
jgi:hypothetical protein